MYRWISSIKKISFLLVQEKKGPKMKWIDLRKENGKWCRNPGRLHLLQLGRQNPAVAPDPGSTRWGSLPVPPVHCPVVHPDLKNSPGSGNLGKETSPQEENAPASQTGASSGEQGGVAPPKWTARSLSPIQTESFQNLDSVTLQVAPPGHLPLECAGAAGTQPCGSWTATGSGYVFIPNWPAPAQPLPAFRGPLDGRSSTEQTRATPGGGILGGSGLPFRVLIDLFLESDFKGGNPANRPRSKSRRGRPPKRATTPQGQRRGRRRVSAPRAAHPPHVPAKPAGKHGSYLHITSCVRRTRHISGFLFCPS